MNLTSFIDLVLAFAGMDKLSELDYLETNCISSSLADWALQMLLQHGRD
jgi:hypothetical protein